MSTPRFSGVREIVRVAFLRPGQEFVTMLTARRGVVQAENHGGPGVLVKWDDGRPTVVHDGLRVLVEVPQREELVVH